MKCLNCNKDISETLEEGVNETDFYICEDCHLGFNVLTSKLDDDLEILK